MILYTGQGWLRTLFVQWTGKINIVRFFLYRMKLEIACTDDAYDS